MFWNKFVSLCARERVSPSAVCMSLGFSNATATHWKNGSHPSATSLSRIAGYFAVAPEYFTTEDETVVRARRIPVYGKVAAGIPIEAITDIDDYEEIDEAMAASGEYFALRIRGDSMEPRMRSGDTVIVRRQDDCDSGEVAIVMIGGEDATCKRIRKLDGGIMLIPDNQKYDPMIYTRAEAQQIGISILGKVVELRARY